MARFFAMTSRGLVDVLEQELQALGVERLLKGQGGVFFDSNWAGCYRANLRLRSATRVLLPILDFPAYNPDELYANIRKHDYTKYISPRGTIAIESKIRECGVFRDQRFVSMKIKDAIVDQFREKFDERPDVDSDQPDLKIVVRAVKNQFSVSIDTSGDPLFKRGYRVAQTDAPIKEHVAAGLLLMTDWKCDRPLLDPMCGSGTFLIEAALMALKIAPGTLRKRFGFQSLKGFDEDAFQAELDACIADEVTDGLPFKIYGSDIDREAIAATNKNAKSAGVDEYIEVTRAAIEVLDVPEGDGVMICNPPYGERLGSFDNLEDTYKNLAFLMKSKLKGWTCYILSGAPELSMAMKLKAERKFPVFNGPIECRFLKYKMF
jgi:23S rRNA G2445 N2-methylase RlmL